MPQNQPHKQQLLVYLLVLTFLLSIPLLPAAAKAEAAPSPAPTQAPAEQGDEWLEPGFPVKTIHRIGTSIVGCGIQAVVGNIDNEPTLEILVTGLPSGPLYAWNSDGSPVDGWPLTYHEAGYIALGNFEGSRDKLEIFAVYLDGHMLVMDGSGKTLPGWPRDDATDAGLPAAVDIDGDGLDEIFLGQGRFNLAAYKADGTYLPGWPVTETVGGQNRNPPAIGDVDGDGNYEIFVTGQASFPGVYLFGYHHDGSTITGFPILFPTYGLIISTPVLGDVDGDGTVEIVIIEAEEKFSSDRKDLVYIISPDGKIEREIQLPEDVKNGSPLILSDLDNNGIPEIIVQTEHYINVWRGNGRVFPGWQHESAKLMPNDGISYGLPVVGDIDGDLRPDVIILTCCSLNFGHVSAQSRFNESTGFLAVSNYLGLGGVPAVADIDLDGRNEIIMIGSYWTVVEGYYDKVSVYDFGRNEAKPWRDGPIQWGQFNNGPGHPGTYKSPGLLKFLFLPVMNQ